MLFFKYDFFDSYSLDTGFHKLNELYPKDILNYYQEINLLLHFKFIKPDIKEKLMTKIDDNNSLNEDNVKYDQFEGWCKEIESYSKFWTNFEINNGDF